MTAIGHYELEERLGSGGMGTVFRGTDTRTQEKVAVKQLRSDIATPEMIERFQREGEALRDLNHPNIVKLLDTVEQDGQHFLIMEYVAGGDLSSLLQHGPMTIEQALEVALDLADALTRAHKLNIIHRDLKPANVLLAKNGVLKLTDFGVAHIAEKNRVTQTNVIIGTVDYLAPEAFSGTSLDARFDIWAFGVMLFEMLAGDKPFKGDTTPQVIHSITTATLPDLEAQRPDLPPALVDLIYRMLNRDPLARIASARHIGAALEDISKGRA
ncbi:MAG: serine/threonine protein kinase, partial [Chloroflexi bacterium]|nr:serine/threonine protein kinase [Chloroflexota bacterium]